ncbi:MAG TPA: hypothetical protein VF553_06835, partial [Pyrinomonadaceae bacterium]
MIEWLRPLSMMFYAPARGMEEVRERAALLRAVLLALVAQALYAFYTQWPHLKGGMALRSIFALVASGFSLLFIAFIFVPITIFVA